jgi:hypothetical protein
VFIAVRSRIAIPTQPFFSKEPARCRASSFLLNTLTLVFSRKKFSKKQKIIPQSA